MDFYAEATTVLLSERPPLCRFCLQTGENTRLERRDLTTFYTTFWPCGLGQQFTENEPSGLVCAYCWTRARQCVKFVQCSRNAERFLSNENVHASIQTFKFYNLSSTKLDPLDCTDHLFRADAQETDLNSSDSPQKSGRNSSDTNILPQFPFEASNCTESHNDAYNVKADKHDDELRISVLIKTEPGAATDMKRELSLSDCESNSSAESKVENHDPMIAMRKKAINESKEIEGDKLKDLHMEPLRYSVSEQLEEIATKKKSEKYLSKKYKCERCGSGYNDEEAYDGHVMKFHDQSAGALECGVCGYRFPAAQQLQRHRGQHARRWRCLDCGAVLVKRGQCATHHARCGACPQTHACQLCGNTFPSEIRMKIHVRKSHTRRKEKRFSCDICGRSFIYKYQIRDHIRSHLNIRPFQCETCGKKFINQSLYNSHQKAHSPPAALEERYCVECDRHFTSPQHLESHLTSSLRHVSKESFRHACSECPERFKVASHLRLHVTTVHLNERAYPCQQCGKAYYTKAALKIHVRNKHTQRERRRDHVCPVCDKSFLTSTTLKHHTVGVHSNERPYACDICGATFGFKAALYTHNKLKHKAGGSGPPPREHGVVGAREDSSPGDTGLILSAKKYKSRSLLI